MHKILIVDNVDPKAKELLEANGNFSVDIKNGLTREETLEVIPEYDALILRSGTAVDQEFLDKAEKLKFIARAGAGYNNVDTEYAKEKEVIVTNAPGQNSRSVAELTLGHMIAISRHIMIANNTTHAGQWEKKKLVGTELLDKNLGVIGGAGNIGSKVAKMGDLLGMNVSIYDVPGAQSEFPRLELDDLLKNSDYVTIHVPFMPATKDMLAKEQFKQMKPTAYLVNTARGGVVNEQDLVDALNAGELAGAAMDVCAVEPIEDTNPMRNVNNLHLSPHIGGNTNEAKTNCAVYSAESIIKYFVDGEVRSQVN